MSYSSGPNTVFSNIFRSMVFLFKISSCASSVFLIDSCTSGELKSTFTAFKSLPGRRICSLVIFHIGYVRNDKHLLYLYANTYAMQEESMSLSSSPYRSPLAHSPTFYIDFSRRYLRLPTSDHILLHLRPLQRSSSVVNQCRCVALYRFIIL